MVHVIVNNKMAAVTRYSDQVSTYQKDGKKIASHKLKRIGLISK